MANFNTHISVATGASFIAGLGAYTVGLVAVPQTLFLILLGSLGGILPDIDAPNSTAVEWVFNLIGAAISLIFIFGLLAELGVILSLLLGVGIFFMITKFVKPFLAKICVHRGVIHSIPVGLIFASITIILVDFFTKNIIFSWTCGIFIFFGFIIHLVLDELYSVNLSGVRLKKSFGTAFSFFSRKNFIGYVIAYAIFATLIFRSVSANLLPQAWR